MKRRNSRVLWVKDRPLGGSNPILVQSMNNCPSRDLDANLRQIERLAARGCDLTRLAVPDLETAKLLPELVARSPLPLVADIHFSARLALLAIEAGMHAIRINPGNIHDPEGLRQIARAAKARRIPIRVGVNSGSISESCRTKYGGICPEALVDEAMAACALLEAENFFDICLSLKASDPSFCIESYRLAQARCDYPFHLGVTEAGTEREGVIRSAVGIGTLLAEGIGDTIRVSLTAEPEKEVEAAYQILKALNLRQYGPHLIACPTCGRTQVDLAELAGQVEKILADYQEPLRVAVMGCAVNGPGEAREADCGIAGGQGEYLIFREGEILRKVPESEALAALRAEIDAAAQRYRERKS